MDGFTQYAGYSLVMRHCPVALHFNYLDVVVVAREAEGPPLLFPQWDNCHESLRIESCRRWLAAHLLGSKLPVPLILLLVSTPLIVFISVPHLFWSASVCGLLCACTSRPPLESSYLSWRLECRYLAKCALKIQKAFSMFRACSSVDFYMKTHFTWFICLGVQNTNCYYWSLNSMTITSTPDDWQIKGNNAWSSGAVSCLSGVVYVVNINCPIETNGCIK